MKNPWLTIPAADYEAHMALPQVAQAQVLNELMASALAQYAPASLAVFGCTTGNGFEHIDTAHTRRVVAVDINPDYLAALKSRFAEKISGLALIATDVAAPEFKIDPVAFAFAGLLFEYVDVADALVNIAGSLEPSAILLSVLQLPSPESGPVTATPYQRLGRLAAIMKLVSPAAFCDLCAGVGLKQIKSDIIPLQQGKAFFVGFYQKIADAHSPSLTANTR